ncbi:DUF4974 domain-containing protein [Flavobacteriaceae bacterium AU392]|nr:FecR family protein [Flavobacteriaceae bacterium]RKM84765.1 DUF4974 domain-containing protein [Flavobacteriaceae bacterium AU392]
MEDIIIRYITSEISKDELKSLKKWLQVDENQKLFEEIVKANQELAIAYNSVDIESAYNNVEKAITQKQILKINPYRILLKYAAILIVLMSISIGMYSVLKPDVPILEDQIVLELEDGSLLDINKNETKVIFNKQREVIANLQLGVLSFSKNTKKNSKLIYNKLIVPYGKQFKLELSDGTLVTINSGSKLRFPTTFFGTKNRDVFIEGEAFFDVKKDESSPFIVHTSDMNIRVLGTKFNVTSYQNEKETFVVLEEGSVAVNKPSEVFDKNKSIIIKSGEQIILENKNEEYKIIQEPDLDKHFAWKEGVLFFKNDRFEDIIKKLERYYNIDIKNNSSHLNNVRYTGTFKGEKLAEVLDTFKELSEFNYKIEGDVIIINQV